MIKSAAMAVTKGSTMRAAMDAAKPPRERIRSNTDQAFADWKKSRPQAQRILALRFILKKENQSLKSALERRETIKSEIGTIGKYSCKKSRG